ncbi:TRAP transporter small permease subunit [Magnetospira sp. QH-2]|uniref:TRAP transporter small permease subunit n=1 Tax=Magnetospira sp. (strain QH-2) TaxID=1288970 RepID=UPI0003E811E3|nr:TRAP transporter small permease subunit [Magnetospira sp. QH-2]CCQ74543.1 TRAP-type mannitol/chloroaromatic compound transport system,DctQ subunit,small permease component [Magnetospira sp. QH-2]
MNSPIDFRDQDLKAISHTEPDGLQFIIHHTALPHTFLSLGLDGVIKRIGSLVSWVWPLLVAVIVLNVTMRYVFGEGRIEFEEIQWHIYAVGFLIGLSYGFEADDHVRVDVLHEHFGLKAQAWVEMLGILIFMLPFTWLVIYFAWPFVESSFAIDEVSDSPGGLPMRWVIKAVLPLAFLLLLAAAVSRLSRATALLFGHPRPKIFETINGQICPVDYKPGK